MSTQSPAPAIPTGGVMYLGAGDSQSGEQRDSRRLNPQRLDALVGKILRIAPDLREHVSSSTVSGNGRYQIPNDNPFATLDGARKEIWAYGLRNPHRLIWDVEPARPGSPTLFAFDIGLVGNQAQGAVKAGITISVIEEQGGKQPPDLTDEQWDHGSSDGEIFAVIKRGLPPTMMAGFDGRIPDDDIWNIVNYLRTLRARK